MEFDWEPAKELANQKKHATSFRVAVSVFDDPFLLTEDSTKPEYSETRYKAIGMLDDGRLVAVIYTDRGSFRRIISVRKTRDNKRRQYDQGKIAS